MKDKVTTAATNPIAVVLEQGKTYWWCSCGLSKSQPFCDGSHKTTALLPEKFIAARSEEVWLCACKQTRKQPFCDGSHKALVD